MIKQLSVAFVIAMLSVAVLIASFFSAASIAAASSTIFVQGTKVVNSPASDPAEIKMVEWIQGSSQGSFTLLDYPRTMWPVPNLSAVTFDVSTKIGVNALYESIVSNTEEKVIYGHSQGAAVQSMLIESHVSGNRPIMLASDQLSFVMISNPCRPNGGILSRFAGLNIPFLGITFHGPTPESEYKVNDISKQYDAVSDFPVRPLNFLALLNAALGYHYLHGDYSGVDLNDPMNIVQVAGNTTYITVPTKRLPLLQPVRDLLALVGRTETPLLDAIEPVLKQVIDSAYDRTSIGYQPVQIFSSFYNGESQRSGYDQPVATNSRNSASGRSAVVVKPVTSSATRNLKKLSHSNADSRVSARTDNGSRRVAERAS